MKIAITAERLHETLNYNPETGFWTWLVSTNRRIRIGDRAGHSDGDRYLYVTVDGVIYLAHRLAWLYMTGEWPVAEIDHMDLDKKNNRWCNLREATRGQNLANKRAESRNLSGLKGVSIRHNMRSVKWYAQISISKKKKHIGAFDCPAAAHLSYVIEANKRFGEFARAS